MDIKSVCQERAIPIFVHGIGPVEVHVARVLQLVFDLVADAVEQDVLEVLAEKQRREARGAERVDLPHCLDAALHEGKSLVEPFETCVHLLDLHFVISE